MSEWHICILKSPQETRFYASRNHEFKNCRPEQAYFLVSRRSRFCSTSPCLQVNRMWTPRLTLSPKEADDRGPVNPSCWYKSSQNVKKKLLIWGLTCLTLVCSRTVRSTSCSLIQQSKSHFKEIWEWTVLPASVTDGSSSLMVTNAVDQWQSKLLCTIVGHHLLGVPICFIIDHLKDTVKTSHRARLEWNYG